MFSVPCVARKSYWSEAFQMTWQNPLERFPSAKVQKWCRCSNNQKYQNLESISKKRVQGGRLPTIVLWWQAKKTNTRFNPATVHFSGHSMSKICAICGILHQEPCSIDWPPSTCRFYRLQAVGNWLLTKCNAWKHMKSRFIMHMTKTGLYASGPIPW